MYGTSKAEMQWLFLLAEPFPRGSWSFSKPLIFVCRKSELAWLCIESLRRRRESFPAQRWKWFQLWGGIDSVRLSGDSVCPSDFFLNCLYSSKDHRNFEISIQTLFSLIKKELAPPGFVPGSFWFEVGRSTNRATGSLLKCIDNLEFIILLMPCRVT